MKLRRGRPRGTPDFPVLVAEQNGRVVGYTALYRWSDRRAYDITAELSLYVTPELHRRGIGRELFKQILAAAEVSGIYTVISRITADNDVSLKLHERFGFRTVGVLQRCGKKFNRILDVVILQKLVKQHDTF
jgi:phosphinothricin acetyltransferase